MTNVCVFLQITFNTNIQIIIIIIIIEKIIKNAIHNTG